ncbi:major facilitator superfamily domain-containing protein [Tribonema minus]|uniref:Major facilitator superfamily domain-containing protein n=1 Tax=Tribonema minus TaxID=303371 RepID=A0A835YPW8_9STRA|nr:major facilitator superfamily domain-containing protein [Tribonema minus]
MALCGGGVPDGTDEDEDALAASRGSSQTGLLQGSPSSSPITLDTYIDNSSPRFQRRVLLPLALGNAADAVEILSIGYIMTVYEGPTGSPLTAVEKQSLTAAVFVGMLVGGVLVGPLADRLGRRPCLLLSLAVNLAFATLSAAAPSVAWLVAARVLAGLGVGGSIPAVFTLGAELFPTAARGRGLSLVASFWMVGALYAAAAAWLLLGDGASGARIAPWGTWRLYALVAAAPAAAALALTRAWVPESPRYLARRRRYGDAARVLSAMTGAAVSAEKVEAACAAAAAAADGAACDAAEHAECGRGASEGEAAAYAALPAGAAPRSCRRRSAADSAAHHAHFRGGEHAVHDGGSGGSGGRAESWTAAAAPLLRLFVPPTARTTYVLMATWFALSYGSYGISTWNATLFADIGLGNPFASSFVYALGNLPGNVVSILYVERVGRRRMLCVSMAGAAAAAALFALGTRGGAALVVGAATTFNALSVAGWNCLDCLSAESFPTGVRASGMGLVAACGRAGSVAAQLVNGRLERDVPLLLLVTSGLMLAGAGAAALLPRETAGRALQEGDGGGDSGDGDAHGGAAVAAAADGVEGGK